MTNCPWSHLEPGSISFCEERMCAWIVEPSNTWSNLAYLLVGLYIIYIRNQQEKKPISYFAIVSIYLFFGSSAFHATGTFIGEVLDLSAMMLLSLAMLSINLRRHLNWSEKKSYQFFALCFFLSIAALFIRKDSGIPIFTIQLMAACYLEFTIYKRLKLPQSDYRAFITALILFGIAFFFWVLDITKILCNPSNHILTGHAVWHIVNGITIYYLYKHYEKFLDSKNT